MSTGTTVNQTSNQLHTDYDNSIIFLGCNRYSTAEYTNSTGSSVDLEAGTLLGRISASGKLLPLASGATDDSNIPVGILSHNITVANGATVTLTYCNEGDVAEDKIIFDGSDDLDTVVSGRQLRDRIEGDTVGINLVASTSMTSYDNQ
jgi:hypothetical protein